jgi:hypothetical protein
MLVKVFQTVVCTVCRAVHGTQYTPQPDHRSRRAYMYISFQPSEAFVNEPKTFLLVQILACLTLQTLLRAEISR